MYKIVQSPNIILRDTAKPVDLPVGRLLAITTEMTATMLAQTDPEGVGLAANQVGLPYRLFVARFDTKKTSPVFAFINPELIEHSTNLQPTKETEKKSPLEGCLSLPRYYGVVKRWQWVKIKYQTLVEDAVQTKTEVFSDFPAVVIQHEMDHLDGRIFVERLLEQKGRLYRVNGKNHKGKDVWEEVEF